MRSVSSFRAVYKKCTMRFLIVATAVLACAAAVPSGLLPASYSAPLAVAPVARLAPAQPTISAGDINGAALEARAEASDHLRAAVDANRQLNDKVSELNGQAINNAEENAWRAVDVIKTAEAQLDGAAASAAPTIAKSIVRSSVVAPAVSYAAPAVAVAAPAVAVAAPAVSYAAPAVSYAAPAVSYAAPAASYAAPAFAAAPVEYAAAPAVYSAPLSYTAPLNYGLAW